uniref:single-stranded DNA cytosine deaminase n=1 Tax=Sus scrofa TaxID=9823 RepID=A0A8D2C152_PIG
MNLLKENIFIQQFGNQPRVLAPYYLRKTYLCYQVKGPDDSILDKGCFQNKKKRHAEIRFIDKINSLNLDQNQCYRIICYVTWSPCHNCAKELVDFISNRHHLSLQLFASRLYFHWVRCYQRGLQRLQAKRVSVAVMKGPEFKDCWEKFVDHQGRSFPSWEKLEQYSESISRRLSRILRVRCWRLLRTPPPPPPPPPTPSQLQPFLLSGALLPCSLATAPHSFLFSHDTLFCSCLPGVPSSFLLSVRRRSLARGF